MIEPHGITVAAAAKVLGVSRPALSTFLNGRSDRSGIMALRIEKAFGVKMDTLMRMQASYDIAASSPIARRMTHAAGGPNGGDQNTR